MTGEDPRLHVVHVVHAFAMGGLENVVVQLINHLPQTRFRHTVLALTQVTDFKQRVTVPDVQFVALNKAPGHAVPLYPRIVQLLRQWRPAVVHTCNLAGLELAPLAWWAGVPLRVHAEHGWDVHDRNGSNPKYQWVRRFYRPFVSRYVSVSQDLHDYLGRAVGVPARRRVLIGNGVDTQRFAPRTAQTPPPADWPFIAGQHWVLGTVGRMQTVKNQPLLARAFVQMLQQHPEAAARARLVMLGDGPLMAEVQQVLAQAGVAHLAWLPGARSDIADLLPWFDTFALPSQTEGTSCTLQEAMACGLPAVVTAVGGSPDLVQPQRNGWLVPSDDVNAMADALWSAYSQPALGQAYGQAARSLACSGFSLDGMIARYTELFDPARRAST